MDDGESRPSGVWIHIGRNGTHNLATSLPLSLSQKLDCSTDNNPNSGHTHTMLVTSVQLQTKQLTGSPLRRYRMETIFTMMFYHIYRDRGYRDVLVAERIIPGQNMQTEVMSEDPHRRLICSKPRWAVNLWVGKFHNLHNLRWVVTRFWEIMFTWRNLSRSIRHIIGIIRLHIWSLVIRPSRIWMDLLETSPNKQHQL